LLEKGQCHAKPTSHFPQPLHSRSYHTRLLSHELLCHMTADS